MKQVLFATLLLLSFCSCSNLYFPDRTCVAGVSQKGEWKANVGAKVQATKGSKVSLYADGVHAFSKNLFWMASYRNIHNRYGGTDFLGYNDWSVSSGDRGDVGLGGWLQATPEWRVELAGGYGMGRISRQYPDNNDKHDFKATYQRLFAQVAATTTGKNATFAGGARMSAQFGYAFDKAWPELAPDLMVRSFEPFAHVEVGQDIRFNAQVGLSIYDVTGWGANMKPYLTLGICFRHLPERKKH